MLSYKIFNVRKKLFVTPQIKKKKNPKLNVSKVTEKYF